MSGAVKYELKEEDVLLHQAEDTYDEESSIFLAKEQFDKFEKENFLVRGEFEEHNWTFSIDGKRGFTASFEFGDIMKPEIRMKMKCWLTEQLVSKKAEGLQAIFKHLKEVIKQSNYFSADKVESLADFIKIGVVQSYQRDTVSKTINFLDYGCVENGEEYINELSLLLAGKTLVSRDGIRGLPPYEDVLLFHYTLDRFVKEWNDSEKEMFYPVLLWWKITSVIPMRIGEFCNIERNAVFVENGKFFIRIPRSKQKKADARLEVVDTLEIDHSVFEMIVDYVELSNSYGPTNTLISYPLYKQFVGDDSSNHSSRYFNRKNFQGLLDKYYDYVFSTKYQIENVHRIKPNDTRHFAFCSLMLQGLNRLTIARLGGHRSLESQNHYQRHLDYFVQSKVYELSRIYKLNQDRTFFGMTSSLSLKEMEINSLQPATNFSHLEKMDIGYCTDPAMNCESDHCQLCSKFWISKEELKKEHQSLLDFSSSYEKRIQERVEIMNRLRREMEFDSGEAPSSYEQETLSREALLLETDIQDLSKIKAQIERLGE